MDKPVTEPVTEPKPKPDNQQFILEKISLRPAIEAKRVELLGAKHQLEFQLNGVVNQLHLIDQLLHPAPEPKPEPDNTI